MLSNILWGLFLILFITLMVYFDKRKQKKKFHTPYREKTEQEKEVERAIEKDRYRGPGGM
ncbi:hypothetical protein LG329_02015 [Virgibacillus necropolis]|uniref:hypothetical protein n=1 Tax=Virgibacillus necropolis TaxID=163877 RepID=UPI0038512948